MRHVVGLVLFCGLANIGHAQQMQGAYVGAGISVVSYAQPAGVASPEVSSDANAFRILGGYRLSDRYAVEAGFGTTADIARTFSAFSVRGIALVPLSTIDLFGGVGYYEAMFNKSARSGADDGFEHTDSGVTVIGGLMFNLPRISIRGEYEWFDTDGEREASSISVLVLLRF